MDEVEEGEGQEGSQKVATRGKSLVSSILPFEKTMLFPVVVVVAELDVVVGVWHII